jgi:hypothetical protein
VTSEWFSLPVTATLAVAGLFFANSVRRRTHAEGESRGAAEAAPL